MSKAVINTRNLSRAYIHKVMRDYPWRHYELSQEARDTGKKSLALAVWKELRKGGS